MPVMGPSYSDEQVSKAHEEILVLLKKYGIQQDINTDALLHNEYRVRRQERNLHLKEAIRSLFELQSWEDF